MLSILTQREKMLSVCAVLLTSQRLAYLEVLIVSRNCTLPIDA
ncbi:hypothetical protein M3J09_007585 [Ascochyta lentis]